ncbi:uncharacterized protein Z518_00383 [Rhinocladiella mackenziei CBS 650.93]|uniref:Rhinocladiella mackenziei CBS 650.93 unplaced genomic scaffold supercont1.1, whole genome shotgun sequence n=1 Tax=Rhinocladiella mackenziei CBS 650.93 TaxID=1442369 RepID=A0A0D2ITC3_9EURO|nr:uncharacterized protein Z518_00383 [Rhinocladiella mackenziei CBS 650.93]KIX09304.1 hypothetical protein Z518_00383 [Rhinocladiella mackenziei CBS 650.93]
MSSEPPPLQTFNCHCGSIKFSVHNDLSQISDCTCSICTKTGRMHIRASSSPSVPGSFHLAWHSPASSEAAALPHLSSYSFGSNRLITDFCPTCGCHIRVRLAPTDTNADTPTRALNVRMIQALEPWSFETTETLTAPAKFPPAYIEPEFKGTNFTDEELGGGKVKYQGSCHCGAVTLSLRTRPLSELMIRECNCSLCWRKALIHCPVENQEDVRVSGVKEAVVVYKPEKLNQGLFCMNCGVQVVTRGQNGNVYAVNLRTMHGVDWEEVEVGRAKGRELSPEYKVGGEAT